MNSEKKKSSQSDLEVFFRTYGCAPSAAEYRELRALLVKKTQKNTTASDSKTDRSQINAPRAVK